MPHPTSPRTPYEILHMIREIETEIKRIPLLNAFGESNEKDLNKLNQWREHLEGSIDNSHLSDCDCEAHKWLREKGRSPLNDFVEYQPTEHEEIDKLLKMVSAKLLSFNNTKAKVSNGLPEHVGKIWLIPNGSPVFSDFIIDDYDSKIFH